MNKAKCLFLLTFSLVCCALSGQQTKADSLAPPLHFLPLPSLSKADPNLKFNPSNLPLIQTHLPFFCKLEVEMESKLKLPVKMRLGDIDQVDYLEGYREFPPVKN